MLNESLTQDRSAFCAISWLIAASVVRKQSMVPIWGWIMPAPFVIPPRVTCFPSSVKVTAASLRTVSVVMIASAAMLAASLE